LKKIVITSGYFDPLHIGHIECFRLARALGDRLIVIVNNNEQALLKKGREFMPCKERMEIVRSLRMVDEVIESIDTDPSVKWSLALLRKLHPHAELIFAKGGDRHTSEIPEAQTCRELCIRIVDGLGAKVQSSSYLTIKDPILTTEMRIEP
jgi:D-beta-D-heptose 7-phosphate kinase/D-beta-D-heptose 1-phosphate adenosyltransferase